MNDAIDDMTNFNCGFKFQNAIQGYVDTVMQLWGMARQSSSAVGIGQFCYIAIE